MTNPTLQPLIINIQDKRMSSTNLKLKRKNLKPKPKPKPKPNLKSKQKDRRMSNINLEEGVVQSKNLINASGSISVRNIFASERKATMEMTK